jgi:hypothetical protein
MLVTLKEDLLPVHFFFQITGIVRALVTAARWCPRASASANLAVDFDHNYDVEKIYFRPGVQSRIWYLGPCDDLPPARTAVDHVVDVERERGHDDNDDDDNDDDEDDALPPVTTRGPQTGTRADSFFPSSWPPRRS